MTRFRFKKIGKGAFGEVYKIFNKNTSAIEVLKVNKGEPDSLSKETEVMLKMSESEGLTKLKEGQKDKDYLIMILLGKSLGNLMHKSEISIIDVKRV